MFPFEFDEGKLIYKGPDADKLKPIFNELEFKAISARAFGEVTPVYGDRPAIKGSSAVNVWTHCSDDRRRHK